MTDNRAQIRFFEAADVPVILQLMKELALFEGYLDDFAITEQYLIEQGLGGQPLFQLLVALTGDKIVGYGAFYTVPFTFKAQPKIVLKELYFSKAARGLGFGKALFDRLREEALIQGACAIEWLVLENNIPAQAFYRQQGAQIDDQWQTWSVNL